MKATELVASATVQILYQVLEDELKTLQSKIEDRFKVKHPNAAAGLYFAECIQYDGITIAYQVGFLQGMSQSFGILDKIADVIVVYGEVEEKTINNYYSILELKTNPKTWTELWADGVQQGFFENDEEAVSATLNGMADGKSYGDVFQGVADDYSLMKDANATSALNIDGYRLLIRQWAFNVLYDSEKQEMLRNC